MLILMKEELTMLELVIMNSRLEFKVVRFRIFTLIIQPEEDNSETVTTVVVTISSYLVLKTTSCI